MKMRVLLYGETKKLPGNSSMQLRRIKTYGQSRIELCGAKSNMSNLFTKIGLEQERTSGQLRYFFSLNDSQAETTYNELLKIYVPNSTNKTIQEPQETVESRSKTFKLSDLTTDRHAQIPIKTPEEIYTVIQTPTQERTPEIPAEQFNLFA